jgi:hypothetical protein
MISSHLGNLRWFSGLEHARDVARFCSPFKLISPVRFLRSIDFCDCFVEVWTLRNMWVKPDVSLLGICPKLSDVHASIVKAAKDNLSNWIAWVGDEM